MSDNIILIGFMGTGKDAVGREIARKTGKILLSTDDYIGLKENKIINKIFQESGAEYFRELEKGMLLKIKDLKNIVVATGGGIVLDEQNRTLLTQMGTVIHLDANLDIIEKRLKHDVNRPLIRDKKKISRIFEERKGIYDFSDLKVNTSGKKTGEVADEIIQKLQIKDKSVDMAFNTIDVKTELKEYPVYIGSNIATGGEDAMKFSHLNTARAIVITNPLVGTLYLQQLEDILKKYKINPIHIIVPDGEVYKTLDQVRQIYDFLLENELSRTEPIIALGGGVIGDLAGFVASTYKRGCPLIQIPTTLLAQVDAAIGGKTGIDHKLGKNMVGTFYQPDSVIADVAVLRTLSEKEFRNSLAEVVKYGVIKDQKLFSLLEKEREKIFDRDTYILGEIVSRCVQIKSKIVEEDEREEKGIREMLNFGHTIGHIIETLTDYSQYTHGEAVAIGMVEETKRAVRSGQLAEIDLKRIIGLVSSYGLPVAIPDRIGLGDLKKAILQDKKIRQGKIRLPVPEGIGRIVLKEIQCEKFL